MSTQLGGPRRVAIAAATVLLLLTTGFVAGPAIADAPSPSIVDFPVALTPTQIAIDGDTVALAAGTVSVQDVDFSGGTVGAATNVGTQAFSTCSGTSVRTYIYSPNRCQMLAQSNGETLWNRSGSAGVSTLAGPPTIVTSPHTGAFISTAAISGKWILTADAYLIDSTTGQSTTTNSSGLDLLDGVEYVPGDSQLTTTASVLARNLTTGIGSAISVPECLDVERVQAAGSWLLVTCELPDTTQSYVVVDRTGVVPDREVPITGDYVLLGNGFLSRETPAGEVDWTALDGASLAWTQLATVAGPYNDFAVSRGSAATIGWIDPQGQAHAALLPVTASAVPAQPADGSGLPAAPAITAEGWEDHADLSWPDPPAGEDVTGYALYLGSPTPIILPPTARGYTVSSLQHQTTYDATIVAFNANGRSANASVDYFEQTPHPAQLSDVVGTLDPATGAVTVSWTWTQQAYTDAPVSFDVAAGAYAAAPQGPDARSVVIQTGSNVPSGVNITVHGARGDSIGSAAITVPPGYQAPSPTFSTTGIDPVTSGTTIAATFSAIQGVQPLVEDVRERPASQRTWTYPPSLQNAPPGTAHIHIDGTPGSAYCFSARATDVDGVLTQWTAPQCTAIPRSDRTLARVHSWKLLSGASYLYRTASESVNTSSVLTTTITASQVWVIATTCPTCGTLGFRVGSGTMLLSLHSATTIPNADVYVPWGLNLSGKISLVQVTAGKPVTVEGIAYLPILPAALPVLGGPVAMHIR